MTQAGSGVWDSFFTEKRQAPPREHLVEAVQYVSRKDAALDLGAGTLRDSKFLLKEGFQNVTAVDNEPAVAEFAKDIDDPRFHLVLSTFEEFTFKENTYDLVNAQYALPFADADSFLELFLKLKESLCQNGLFVGTFFGLNDDWNTPTGKASVFHSREQIQNLLEDFEILSFVEEEVDNPIEGKPKHSHRFHVTARKK